MSLTVSLNTALSGLNVNQAALATLSQNIANANTPGYSKQIVNLEAVYIDGTGSGVDVAEVTRRVDTYLQASIVGQQSVLGDISVQADYAERIQTLLGRPSTGTDVGSSITGFFNALETLSLRPEDPTQQSAVVSAGEQLAQRANRIASELQELRFQADQDIDTLVTEVNDILQELFNLNSQIVSDRLAGISTAGLEDTQDALLNQLASNISFQTFRSEGGQVNIFSDNGVSLLDSSLHQLAYSQAGSAAVFSSDSNLSAVEVLNIDRSGNEFGSRGILATGGPSSGVVSNVEGGRLSGLLTLRDTELPAILDQLNLLSATIRDEVNAIHNLGSGFPGESSLTGSRLLAANDFNEWSGSIRIALIDDTGNPIPSLYADQAAITPLTLDLSVLDSGNGAGSPSTQGIIDAINQFFTPRAKVTIGNVNNIQLVSLTDTLPDASSQFNFDLDLENISSTDSSVYVTDIRLRDSNDVVLADPTSTQQNFTVASYDTTDGSSTVVVNIADTTGLIEGQQIFLSNPGGAVNGVVASELTGYFTVSNITGTTFEINTSGTANATGNQVPVSATNATPPYSTATALSNSRSGTDGIFTADLSGNTTSPFYTVSLDIGVDDGDGNIKTTTVEYRIPNNLVNMQNDYFGALSAGGDATLTQPSTSTPQVVASLVDENGDLLSQTSGQFALNQSGFLRIATSNSSYNVVIDSLDSSENGRTQTSPAVEGTGRGFSHYFALNNFFVEPTDPTTPNANAAEQLEVVSSIIARPSNLSLGVLTRNSTTPYAFERNIGDNTIIAQLSGLSNANLQFAAAGGLGETTRSLNDYAAQFVSATSTKATRLFREQDNAESLFQGFTDQASAISGVNLDEELANTIIYQNAYSATARIITVTDELFETLINSF